jgi:hypothetical protein
MKEIKNTIYTVSMGTFLIPFYYGSGSSTAKSYGSYGSGSATLFQYPSIAFEGQRQASRSLAKRKFTSDFSYSLYLLGCNIRKTHPALLLLGGGQHEISPVVVLLREEHELNPFPESLRGQNTGSHRRMTGLRSRDSCFLSLAHLINLPPPSPQTVSFTVYI